MERLIQIELGDAQLMRAVDSATAEAVRRSGPWVVCRLECTECCRGPFAITQLDVLRLRKGLAVLDQTDAGRAGRVRERAARYVDDVAAKYPGSLETGVLDDEDVLPASVDDAVCPALDPETGGCDLYEFRPVTCRMFGPAIVVDGGVAACELCYEGAAEEEVARCAVEVDPDGLEASLLSELKFSDLAGSTIVAFALVGTEPPAGRCET